MTLTALARHEPHDVGNTGDTGDNQSAEDPDLREDLEEAVLPSAVRAAFDRLSAPARLSDAAWAVQSAVMADHRVGEGDAAAWVETELQIVEAVEVVKAWADFQGLAAMRRMREAVYEQIRSRNDQLEHGLRRPLMRPGEVSDEAVTGTVDEVALGTGLPSWEVARRLELASDQDGRGARVLSALAGGEVTLDRALRIHRDTQGLGTETALAVSERLLSPGRDGTIRSHAAFLRELRRQIAAHTPDPAETRADAIAARDATAVVDPGAGGTGSLLITGEASRVCAAIDRVDALARRLRGAGDPRTLAQLRSDVALDLLLYGWATAGLCHGASATDGTFDASGGKARDAAGGNAAGGAAGGNARDARDAAQGNARDPARDDLRDAARDPAGAAAGGGMPEQSRTTFIGQPPPARVTVIVPLATLLGIDQAVAELAGHGFVSAVQVRQIATANGSVWRRLVVDPVSGAALDLSTRRYRPTQAMADLVAARDGMCRGPGCTVLADRCDIDHDTPWPAGPTQIDNLSAKHRRHHNHKTRGTWTATTDLDGAITWRTCAKRRYVSAPHDHLDPLNAPVTEDDIERAVVADPPPF